MESSRSSKRRRIIQSYISPPRPDLPATFESLSDDPLTTILEFVGNKSYRSFGGVNKYCKGIYLSSGMAKETFVYGYAPMSVIQNNFFHRTYSSARIALGKGVVFYDRTDILAWAVQEQNKDLLSGICDVAGEEGRIDLLDELWDNVNDEVDKRDVFAVVDWCAARGGKLNVLKWFETKRLSIDKRYCAGEAARGGQLHIIQWLRDERGLKLNRDLYYYPIDGGGHLHVMEWLREQACPWYEYTFKYAACRGNINVLQWLHDEGCPWPDYNRVPERRLKPEVIEWCRSNGYGDRISVRHW